MDEAPGRRRLAQSLADQISSAADTVGDEISDAADTVAEAVGIKKEESEGRRGRYIFRNWRPRRPYLISIYGP